MFKRLAFLGLTLLPLTTFAQNKEIELNVQLPQIIVYANKSNKLDTIVWNGTIQDADISKSVKVNKQKYFPSIPPGNYSGITHIKGSRYALITDKFPSAGYYIFDITFDKEGQIVNVKNMGFTKTGDTNMDEEAIAFNPFNKHLYIGNEENSTIQEVEDDKVLKTVTIEDFKKYGEHNRIIESLCFDANKRHFYTINESTLKGDQKYLLRLKELDEDLKEVKEYSYRMDTPEIEDNKPVNEHAYGVSELLALGDGTLLVLEREFYVTDLKVGSWVQNKIYRILPGHRRKQFVAKWKTRINFTSYNLANYEGMCLGPKLKNGRQVVILCADSQDQYKGILKDWFRTIIL